MGNKSTVTEQTKKRRSSIGPILLFVAFAGVVFAGYLFLNSIKRSRENKLAVAKVEQAVAKDDESTIDRIIASEEWILRTTTELPKLAHGVLNMQLPDALGGAMFADRITVTGLEPDGTPRPEFSVPRLDVNAQSWPVARSAKTGSPSEIKLWNSLFEKLDYFEHAKFYFVKAKFADKKRNSIDADVNFDGVARARDGSLVHIQGKQLITWKKPESGGENTWQIYEWKQKSLTQTRGRQAMFRDVVNQVIPNDLRQWVQGSTHEQLLIDLAAKKTPPPHNYFSPHAADRHPSVSVVDIDRDGFDDLYVMSRWGRNLMFRNRGNGTFEEIAEEIGLDIQHHCASAMFADFDNDGDLDLILGRTLQRSMYLINEDGKFVDRSDSHVSTSLPYLVFSVSSADYNGDGLLDVFFCTYAQETQKMDGADPKTRQWLSTFLSPQDAGRLFEKRNQDTLIDGPGPPNVLLVNRGGGKFALAPENEQLAAWRQSTQAAWSDIDEDGDLDLYLSNDFAPNNMFRNDGPAGFVDVTAETQTADIGFGMGASWGDYDLDGRQDLYVSNMFSKAGRRITSQVKTSDPRLANMARGNSLFRNVGRSFKKVSGLTSSDLQVEKAGWSWSGQFVDIDNNGYLDIYALSGFYTAPESIALPDDL